jgi:hypothetical protein
MNQSCFSSIIENKHQNKTHICVVSIIFLLLILVYPFLQTRLTITCGFSFTYHNSPNREVHSLSFSPYNLKLITPSQMFRLLNLGNKLLLLHTPLTLHPPIQQNTLQLLHSQFRQILLFQIFRLDGEFHTTNF